MYTVYCNDVIDERFPSRKEAAEFLIENFKSITGEPITDHEKELLVSKEEGNTLEEIREDYAMMVSHFENDEVSSGSIIFISKDVSFNGIFSNIEDGVK